VTADGHPNLEGIDLPASYILGVIYDDESLTLEMDFRLLENHPRYAPPEGGACYRNGFIRFADMDDLRLRKAEVDGGPPPNLSEIYSATIDPDYACIVSGWGEIELTARSIRISVD
jgi:hypothetical protein